jgi:hypothetical protein
LLRYYIINYCSDITLIIIAQILHYWLLLRYYIINYCSDITLLIIAQILHYWLLLRYYIINYCSDITLLILLRYYIINSGSHDSIRKLKKLAINVIITSCLRLHQLLQRVLLYFICILASLSKSLLSVLKKSLIMPKG